MIEIKKRYSEDFSLRDWVSWDTETGLILVYEYDEITEQIRKMRGLN